MVKLIFACSISPGASELEAVILARSIRTFAGRFSDSPVWFLVSESDQVIQEETERRLLDLDARLIPHSVEAPVLTFPFALKVVASATAEALAEPKADLLVWMDVDSLILNEPVSLILDGPASLGYRPVDHTLIGSPIDEPADRFWDHIYRSCHVSEADLFPMTTSVDENIIRPYFNAGMLVVRPKRRLLRKWRDRFLDIYQGPPFEAFYTENILTKIFFHQAILAGVVLSALDRDELKELPPSVNYPLHMHDQYPSSSRPSYIDELETCRYDTLFQSPDWREKMLIREPLASWLDDQVRAMDV
jgi:hypothetical protein